MARFKVPPPDEAAAFEELSVIIEELPRFALVFAICASDAAAADHITRYHSLHSATRIAEVHLDWPDGRIYARLREVYEADKPDAIFVTGMEAWTERGEDAKGNEFTVGLNHGRDYMHEFVPCPVVFWCTPTVYNHIRRNAHDFYSIATSTLRVSLPDASTHSVPALMYDLQATQSLTRAERQFRVAELESLIASPNSNTLSTKQLISYLVAISNLYLTDVCFDEARSAIERALSINKEQYEPLTASILLSKLADIEYGTGWHNRAKVLLEMSLQLNREILGPQDVETGTTLHKLAQVEMELGNYSRAKGLFQQALNIYQAAKGQHDPGTAAIISSLGQVEVVLGHYDAAYSLYERALAIEEATLGRRHPETAKTLGSLAHVAQHTGNSSLAKALYEQALSIIEYTLGPEHPDRVMLMVDMAALALETDDLAVAQALAEQARNSIEKSVGEYHHRVSDTYRLLETIYRAQGKTKEAAEMRRKAEVAEATEAERELVA